MSGRLRAVTGTAAVVSALVAFTGTALAHSGGLSGAAPDRLAVPTWLFLFTGGGVVGASFLLASFATDRAFIDHVHELGRRVRVPGSALAWLGRLVGLGGLLLVVVSGFFGPTAPMESAAIVVVWAGWWAGYAMTTYLVGNTWPAVDPFRTLARPLGDGVREYPERLGAWPSVAFLLVLVYVEVTSPLADDPRVLAAVALAYLAVALAGSAAFGVTDWFERVDPISRIFRLYGAVAPITRTDDGLRLRLPGAGLVDDLLADRSEVGFVVALVWATTFDGLTSTPVWTDLAESVVPAGVPAPVLYAGALVGGYLVFLGVYRASARLARRTAPTYRTAADIARLFAPSLLAIAAAYHLAHYLTYFLALSPLLVHALVTPLTVGTVPSLTIPGWLQAIPVVSVLVGHLLAIWVAHSIAFETFPSRIQALRSQYAVTLVMVLYTMTSLWIVTQPELPTPYV